MRKYRSLNKGERAYILHLLSQIQPIREPEKIEIYLDVMAEFYQLQELLERSNAELQAKTKQKVHLCLEYTVKGKAVKLPFLFESPDESGSRNKERS